MIPLTVCHVQTPMVTSGLSPVRSGALTAEGGNEVSEISSSLSRFSGTTDPFSPVFGSIFANKVSNTPSCLRPA
jgi:hypothetical protein